MQLQSTKASRLLSPLEGSEALEGAQQTLRAPQKLQPFSPAPSSSQSEGWWQQQQHCFAK